MACLAGQSNVKPKPIQKADTCSSASRAITISAAPVLIQHGHQVYALISEQCLVILIPYIECIEYTMYEQ